MATRLKNLRARSNVWLVSGRPDSSVSKRTPRTASRANQSCVAATKRCTAGGSPATAKRYVTRLAGCTKAVAGRSSRCIITRGENVENPVPRSVSCAISAAIRNWLSPSHSVSPTVRPKAPSSGGSTHTVPRAGACCTACCTPLASRMATLARSG